MQTHSGLPRLFSEADVARLNSTRSALDQLELVGPSPGLLRHHCCFPRCPLFLVDLRSDKDRAVATASSHKGPHAPPRRHGLVNHLNFFTSPDPSYLPAFHTNAQQLLGRTPHMNKVRFVQSMAQCYGMEYNEKKHALEGRTNRGAMGHDEALGLFEAMWEQRAGMRKGSEVR